MFSEQDQVFMTRALALAAQALYTTTPNPRVGCVLVKDKEIVGEGFHEYAGEPHAEIRALRAAGADKARGATAYVTLEPCNHFGRTPPCTENLIAAKVARVVCAMEDPNPRVAGAGFARLRETGIEVRNGLMEHEARELNIGFAKRMVEGLPWVRLKVAASLDGKTALANGQSQWITGAEARKDGHHWRARACAVLTGIGTVLEDDPQLNVRDVITPRQPTRVIVDSGLQTPPSARILSPELEGGKVLIAAATDDAAKRKSLEAAGAEVIMLPNPSGKVDLPQLMRELGRRQFNEVHVESGFKLNGSLLRERCVDELLMYLAPTIIGNTAQGMFNLAELTDLDKRLKLALHDVTQIGPDLRVLARPQATSA
jgi:diaminohydroxyphosphoribosylaminopyrimidine deaminase / 5-amino-6-(5-phosphoribosylamino)uracil reductase